MKRTGNSVPVLVNESVKTGFTQFELSKLLITSKFFTKNKLSPSARLVLTVLCAHYPSIYPSISTIMEESGIASKTSVINSLKELSQAGFILYETKNVNHYKFTAVFFEELGIEPKRYNNWYSGGTKIGNKQIIENKNKKKELKKFINFSEK
ncbi:MAG: helix-turn-helix domain-containing protein, partial [Candidatus Gastranaerophilales bacterium]|nr:helix-turn-helix domain-containing protein [Candidatus Gastranaerophilales bacterium]